MKKFLAIYTGTQATMEKSGWATMDEAKRKSLEAAGIKAWREWGEKHAKAVLDMGGPLGKTKLTDKQGVSDIRNNMTGYTILQAESHEAAAKMFEKHPHFTIFPGEGVEIMEILPIPGQ
jgi:hypothetical protein